MITSLAEIPCQPQDSSPALGFNSNEFPSTK